MSNSIVRATCPSCGDVVLTADDLGVGLDEGRSWFVFCCPRCHERITREIPSGIVHILHAAGVRQVQPETISDDELAGFLADFERGDCLDELRRLGHGA